MRTSMMSITPASAQALISLSLILRDAFATSIVFSPTPSQKRFKPTDEPPDSTTGVGKSKFSPNASATIDAYGRTVDEPATCTLSRATAAPAANEANAMADTDVFTKDMSYSLDYHLVGKCHPRNMFQLC